jgi:hypothetical protein
MMKLFKITLSTIAIMAAVFFVFPSRAEAQCTQENQCINGQTCRCLDAGCNVIVPDSSIPCGSNQGSRVIGPVIPPAALHTRFGGPGGSTGLIGFFSLLIRLIAIIAGIFAMVNFVIAGLTYITSMGNTQANINVRDRLLFSFVGLLIIVSAYTIAAIIGLIFFGDATYIINPQLQGALN